MGTKETLLGSGGSAGGGSVLTSEQRGLLKNLVAFLQQRGPSEPGPEFFPSSGRLVPDLTQTQQLSLAGLENLASGQTDPQGSPLEQSSSSALTDILGRGPTDAAFEPFAAATIDSPILRALTDAQTIADRGAAGSGTVFGSSREDTSADLSERAFQEIARGRGNLALGVDANRIGAATAAAGQRTPEDIVGDLIANISRTIQVGDAPRQVEQERTAFELQEFLRRFVDAPNTNMAQILAALGIQANFPRGSIAPSEGLVGGLVGGLSGGIGGGIGSLIAGG